MIYGKRGITKDVESLYESKSGKLDNGKYTMGKIKKNMPTFTDFQIALSKRESSKELAEILVTFLKLYLTLLLIVISLSVIDNLHFVIFETMFVSFSLNDNTLNFFKNFFFCVFLNFFIKYRNSANIETPYCDFANSLTKVPLIPW